MARAVDTVTDMIAHKLKAHGETVLLPAGTIQHFVDPSSVWFIVDGSVDLFAVSRHEGRQTGPRQHLVTLAPGALIWGTERSVGGDGISFLAYIETEVRLVQLDVATLETDELRELRSPALVEGIDRWIMALSHGAARYLRPRRTVLRFLSAGEESTLEEKERIGGHKGVVWARLIEGSCSFFDVTPIAVGDGGVLAALTPASWLTVHETCVVQGVSTESLLAEGTLVEHMRQFHRWLFHCLAFSIRAMISMEDARLRAREDRVEADIESTFVGFSKLLNADTAHGRSVTNTDALFTCCTLVGEAMGAAMVLPARWERHRRADERPLDVEDIATASQLRVRMVVLRGRWWTEDNGPLVGCIEEDRRPVALLPRTGSRYVLYDPAVGRYQNVTEKVALQLSPATYMFYSSLPDRPVSGDDILRFGLQRCWRDLLVIIGSGAASGLLATGVPLATGYVFDSLIPDHEGSQLVQVGLALLVVALSATIFHFVVDVAQLRAEGRISGSLQAAFMDRLLRLPNAFFAEYSAGDLAHRIMVIEEIRREMTGLMLGSIIAGVFSVFSLGLLFYYSPIAAALATSLVSIMAGAAVLTGLVLRRAMAAREALTGRLAGVVLGIVTGIAKLRLTAAEDRAFNLWGVLFREMRQREVAVRRTINGYRIFWSGYEVLCLTVVYAIVGEAVAGTISTGDFLGFVAAFASFFAAMSALANAIISAFRVAPRYVRALPIVQTIPENIAGRTDPGVLSGSFEVNGVVFCYTPETPPVLDGLTMSVAAGEFVAVVGPSGSGKSTIMRLLLGFENPEAGGVFYDGRDLRGLDLERVRRQIGVVLQNGRLMPGSIYENIRGATQATVEDCWEAANQAGLAQDINDMPMGMHTVLTEGTSALSGGQVQRILIARAIVGKPRLLLMDEATSALDNQTQAIVTESLDRLSVTRVVIAHRLSTIMKADRIYVVKGGQVVETGSYRDLVSQNGVFAQLSKRQQI